MEISWHDIVVIGTVTVAGVYLAYRAWSVVFHKNAGACGGGSCSGCPSEPARAFVKEKPFISVDELTSKSDESSRD
jgi:hypothetical protein